MFVMGEGGETKSQTNVNYFLEQFGISARDGLNFCSWFFNDFIRKLIFNQFRCAIT